MLYSRVDGSCVCATSSGPCTCTGASACDGSGGGTDVDGDSYNTNSIRNCWREQSDYGRDFDANVDRSFRRGGGWEAQLGIGRDDCDIVVYVYMDVVIHGICVDVLVIYSH